MGLSTDGEISFGIEFEDGYEFPWDAEPYDGDMDEWWLKEVLKFKPINNPFDENGEYINGVRDEVLADKWIKERSAFQDANPKCPVEKVNVCSGDYPMFILAVPGTNKSANRGSPTKFDPKELVVTPEQIQALNDFCTTYGIETTNEPAWYLSSYMG